MLLSYIWAGCPCARGGEPARPGGGWGGRWVSPCLGDANAWHWPWARAPVLRRTRGGAFGPVDAGSCPTALSAAGCGGGVDGKPGRWERGARAAGEQLGGRARHCCSQEETVLPCLKAGSCGRGAVSPRPRGARWARFRRQLRGGPVMARAASGATRGLPPPDPAHGRRLRPLPPGSQPGRWPASSVTCGQPLPPARFSPGCHTVPKRNRPSQRHAEAALPSDGRAGGRTPGDGAMGRGTAGAAAPGASASLAAFASTCSLHGLSHVFLPGPLTPRRVAWAAALLGAAGLFLYQVAERVRYYREYHHVTMLDEQEGRQLLFPAVSLCNFNRVRRSRLTRNDLHWVGRELLGVEPADHLRYLGALGRPEGSDPPFVPSAHFDMREFTERTGHGLEDMLLACRFGTRQCGPENFTRIFTRLGKCYTFNSGAPGHELLSTAKGGTGNGLELMLNVQQDDYLPVWGDADETSYEAGVKVQIHSQHEPPSIDQLGFGVAPGFQTFVSCQQQRLLYLPPPWGDCKAGPLESAFFANYSMAACRIDCETRYLAENCNCRMVHMPGNANVCSPEQYKECANPALDFLVEKDDKFCSCQTPCESVRYGKELSVVRIPSRASAKYLARKYNRSEQYIAENLLMLDIFFEALNYETIEQKKAYEVAGLLGDIGGQMGLFIGASLLTILEIFDYLYEVLRDKLLGYYQSRKQADRGHSESLEYVDLSRSPGSTLPRPPRAPASRCAVAWTTRDSPRTRYLVTQL